MTKAKRAALDVLAKSAEVYNCWDSLDEAVTWGERYGFTRAYVERKMLRRSIDNALLAIARLGREYGINVDAVVEMRGWEAR